MQFLWAESRCLTAGGYHWESSLEQDAELWERADNFWGFDNCYASGEAKSCRKCAEEHRQLAEWLKELKAVHDEIDDADDEDEIFIGYLRKKMKGEPNE